jgi:ABC-type sugar transport system permease subunit
LILLLAVPFTLFILSFTVPLFYEIGLSFYNARGSFVGLANYISLFHDEKFWSSLSYTITYSVVVAGVMSFLGLFIGVFINQLGSGDRFVKSIMLIPWAISLTAWGLLGQIVFSRQFGIVNDLLIRLGLTRQGIPWLGNPSVAKLTIMVSRIYKDVWFSALLFLVARQTIPYELYEEGRVSGANAWQIFWKITFPLLRTTMLYVGIILLIFALQEFDLVYALTRGGPGFATETAAVTIYRNGVLYGNYEYGTAVAAMWSLVITVIVIIFFAPLQMRAIER